MVNALWITLIGMSLVFLAILLLWGLMALLVRLTAEKPALVGEQAAKTAMDEFPEALEETIEAAAGPCCAALKLHERRKQAAVAGVAVAMALQQAGRKQKPAPAGLSAWQSVQRASQLGQHSAVRRKVQQ